MAPKKDSKKAGKEGDGQDDRVHVVVRIRPPVRKDEKFGEGSESLQYDKEKNMLFLLAKEEDESKGVNPKQFVFDRVLWKDSSQHDAWEAAGLSVVKSSMQGYTGCVMCYGQTGAGKTHTLANDKAGQEGVMINAFNYIFDTADSERELKYEVQIAFQQIYLDGISDLLQPSAPVELREDPKEGVYVSGATWDTVTSTKEAIAALHRGFANRATACTKMNADSSRSHAVLMLKIRCTGGVRTLNGMLYLVDLAGSERVKKSGVEGAAFDEAKAINQSLTTLGRCIEVLASNKKEKPPFRESKLTRLLSNAIGGAAKTTLVVCVAPTMTDQFETTNSLDFGQQAMNVVVRAKVNASTDYGSLTASLLAQRDKKQKAIRELEVQVLRELAPKIDEVVQLELECKRAALLVEIAEESVDAEKDKLAAAKAAGEEEAERDKATMVELLNGRARKTEELEQVLVQLSSDPEMKQIQDAHEQEKREVSTKSAALQEGLRAAEHQERGERKKVDAQLEGVIHTAKNLGQIACYFLQTGATEEAADFYTQAKAIFDNLLGEDHPKTRAWQEDLFFLINAPAIQQMVKAAAQELAPDSEAAAAKDTNSAPEWWMQNLFEMGNHSNGEDDEDTMNNWWMQNLYTFDPTSRAEGGDADDDDEQRHWWMQNLYDIGTRSKGEGVENVGESDYMNIIFGTPRDGTTTARGGPAFTPRGTLVALSAAHGKSSAAYSLGMPLQKDKTIPEEESVNMSFAKDWVAKVFLTPRGTGSGGEEMADQTSDAVAWLQDNFGTPRAGSSSSAPAGKISSMPFTPRTSQAAGLLNMTKDADDAVFHAALQATLATPRGSGATASVDDTPMAGAVSKMFKGKLQHV